MTSKEKKMEKPVSIKLRASTKEALDKICQKEDRTLSYVVEKAVREKFGLEK